MSTKKVQKEVQKEKSVAEAKNFDRTTIVNQVAQTKLVAMESLDALTNQLVQKADMLQEVETAIDTKQQILKELNQIEVEVDTLAKLKEAQEETRKQWSREEADYRYNLQKSRNFENDQWAQEKEKRVREFSKELVEKTEEHNAKVLAFKAQEQEFLELKKKVEAFPAQLAEAVLAKEKEVTKSLGSEHHFKTTISQKDTATEIALLKQANQAMQNRITELEHALDEARSAQKEAVVRVQSIAEKAIEGASKQTVVLPTQETSGNMKK